MKFIKYFLVSLLLSSALLAQGATIDSLDIPSALMKKTYKAAVVLPSMYGTKKAAFPVLYLLHGAFGRYDNWLYKTSDKLLLQKLADRFNLIIVLPEGEKFSFYLDSPFSKESQFETYITKEVIEKIDNTYRTVRGSKGRVISGLSMGGFGAIYLANRHPDIFCAAGSMSGAMDLSLTHYKISVEDKNRLRSQFEKVLGPIGEKGGFSFESSPINMLHTIKSSGVKMIIDCGVEDVLLEPNRELNRRLRYAKIPHDYIERPGGHTWEYWENALPYQLQFFDAILKENGTSVF